MLKARLTSGLFLWEAAMESDFSTEEQDQYNWLDPQEPPQESDQHFGAAVGFNPCNVFNGLYETLEEGCYRRRASTDSDDI